MVGIDIIRGGGLWLQLFANEFSLITPPLILLSQTHLHSLFVMVRIDIIRGGGVMVKIVYK